MALNTSAPWHRESFDRFIHERLPRLLAERLPLTGYRAEAVAPRLCRAQVTLGDVEVQYEIPMPDEDGFVESNGHVIVVAPIASSEELEVAEIKCIGEQLYDEIAVRLGEAPADLPWDESLVRAWLPLESWVSGAIWKMWDSPDRSWPGFYQGTGWLERQCALRRLWVPSREKVIAPGQFGRTDPFGTPEGPNIGKILYIALGATIRDGKLVIVDDRPEAALGLSSAMVPFLEQNDPNRLLMANHLVRWWLLQPDSQPAIVQTGNEPDAPDFWRGRDLLTAFVSWGPETYEDGMVISESAAKRFPAPYPLEPGDRISNRHGSKGIIARILRDDEMPHLADGTAVELACSFAAIHTRLTFGQVREALMSRIARAEGEPAIVPPFHAPSDEELRVRLAQAGLPEDGMETLTLGKGGKPLPYRSTVGWVHWGRDAVIQVREKIHASVGCEHANRQGELEYYVLRDAGAFALIAEEFNLRDASRSDAGEFAGRVAAGALEPAGAPSAKFADLAKRLAAAGIQASLEGDKLVFGFAPPEGDVLKLTRPIPHPWLRERELGEIGRYGELPRFKEIVEANDKLARILAGSGPESLVKKATDNLEAAVKAYLDELVKPERLRFGNPILFSARTVAAPDGGLEIDQLGLADEIAWGLFGPLVTRELGNETEVRDRTPKAAKKLDELMARSWVVVNRAPTIIATSILAFRPVRIPDKVLRFNPLVCFLMNMDFDGDQAAVFLPLTEAGQREAGELLSVAGHLRRDPNLFGLRLLTHEALWGLAHLSGTPAGLSEIAKIAGVEVKAPEGYVARETLAEAMREIRHRDGVEKTLEVLQALFRLGMQVTKESGASISPFVGARLPRPVEPDGDDPSAWVAYAEELAERLAGRSDFADSDLGPQLLAAKSGARGTIDHLLRLVGPWGAVTDAAGRCVPIRHGYEHGLSPEELFAATGGAREGLARVAFGTVDPGYGVRLENESRGFSVLARARRASQPGVVLARAAATGEADPLTDLDSRLFVGLSPA